MAGLIAQLFGGKRKANTDPHPGEGGYAMPRGPVGEGGFPGSTAAAPVVHTQSADGRRERQLSASAAQDEWKTLPTRERSGLPRNPRARNKAQADDTYKPSTPVVGANAPGSENVRNTYAQKYKADPSLIRVYLSSPNPGTNGGRSSGNTDNGAVLGGDPTPVTVQSRWVSREGAQEGFTADRRIPYMIHHRPEGYRGAGSNRGADLSGQAYRMEAKEETAGLPDGDYGIARRRGPNHRPVRFEQPGPWAANYRDVAPDEGTHQPNMVRVSPKASAVVTSPSRAHQVETRRSPGKVHRRG